MATFFNKMAGVLGLWGASVFIQGSSVLGDVAGLVQNSASNFVMGSAGDHLRADGQEACVASVPGDDAFDQVVDGMLSQEDSMSTV
jgi:hypothetical protein